MTATAPGVETTTEPQRKEPSYLEVKKGIGSWLGRCCCLCHYHPYKKSPHYDHWFDADHIEFPVVVLCVQTPCWTRILPIPELYWYICCFCPRSWRYLRRHRQVEEWTYGTPQCVDRICCSCGVTRCSLGDVPYNINNSRCLLRYCDLSCVSRFCQKLYINQAALT